MVVTAVKWVDRQRRRLLALVDSDQVRLFQVIVYIGVLVAGIYMFVYHVPSIVEQELGYVMKEVWVVMTSIGPVMVALGQRLVQSGEHHVLCEAKTGGGIRIYFGWYFQLGGDLVVALVFTTYVVSSVQTAWATRGIFAAFIIASLVVCAGILVLRDFRRIRGIERS